MSKIKNNVQFEILKACKVNKAGFIKFWSEQYTDSNKKLYENNIGHKLTEKRILELFKWKNGGNLSKLKEKSVKTNYIFGSQTIPKNPSIDFLKMFLNKPGRAIWRIFWLHCNLPKQFPIYDQNVHRAMAQLKGWKKVEIPQSDRAKIDMYLEHYVKFYRQLNSACSDNKRRIDKALWAYGDFLKRYPRFG